MGSSLFGVPHIMNAQAFIAVLGAPWWLIIGIPVVLLLAMWFAVFWLILEDLSHEDPA